MDSRVSAPESEIQNPKSKIGFPRPSHLVPRTFAVLGVLLLLSCLPSRIAVKPGTGIIHGQVAPGFEEVAAEFERNFTERGEYDAACCVYLRGEKVVDLWGGYRDMRTRAPWEENTLVPVFSVTKGMASMCLALCHSRGWLDFDLPVAFYWPEFGSSGKADITVRELLGHQAGLPCLDVPLRMKDLEDFDSLAVILARQKPLWEPGTRHGYHAATLGLYMNELLRRLDPAHRTLGRFFQDEIARPLGIEFYIGLPREVPDERVADIVMLNPVKVALSMPWRLTSGFLCRRSLIYRSTMIPVDAGLDDARLRTVEQPSADGIGEVRAIARAYSEFATGGQTLGLSRRTLAELEGPPVEPGQGPLDAVLGDSAYYRLGFFKPGPSPAFGSSEAAFGVSGLGGSTGFADPDRQVGFAYAPIRLGYRLSDDPRLKALQDVVYRCIARVEDADAGPAPAEE